MTTKKATAPFTAPILYQSAMQASPRCLRLLLSRDCHEMSRDTLLRHAARASATLNQPCLIRRQKIKTHLQEACKFRRLLQQWLLGSSPLRHNQSEDPRR